MKAVWKFTIQGPRQTIEMPAGAKILSLQTQHNEPQIWALVDTHAPKESRTFRAVPTGADFIDDEMTYIGTFQINNGSLVFHIFEETP
jgi:hypothetical protein